MLLCYASFKNRRLEMLAETILRRTSIASYTLKSYGAMSSTPGPPRSVGVPESLEYLNCSRATYVYITSRHNSPRCPDICSSSQCLLLQFFRDTVHDAMGMLISIFST